ncbi:MAG TPA: DUF6011 domain-containing protein [Thermaerobacter sp.]
MAVQKTQQPELESPGGGCAGIPRPQAYQTNEVAIKVGRCSRCGRPLRDPASVKRGMGPVCYGRSKGGIFDRLLDAPDEEWAEREEALRRGVEVDLGQNWSWLVRRDDVVVRVPARISVRYNAERDRYEAYARIFDPRGAYDEILYSGKDIQAAYRAAVQAGPQMEALVYRATRAVRRRVA